MSHGRLALVVVSALLSSTASAHAAVVVGTSPIGSPAASTGFESFTSLPINTDYVDGGVAVRYVSSNLDDGVSDDIPYHLSDPHGAGSWSMIDNHGYTAARLAGGGTFNVFSGFFGSSWADGGGYGDLLVVLRLAGATVDEIDAGPLSTLGRTYSFSGFTADEVWIKSQQFAGPFSAPLNDRTGIDDLAFGNATAGAPEPASWALMILGFAAAGAALRRRLFSATAGQLRL